MNVTKPKLTAELKQITPKKAVMTEVINAILANRRRGAAHAKSRGAVSGGGKKPWRQKGTGRARAGSNRSPLWKGGGVVFAPTGEQNFGKKVTKKKKRQALIQSVIQRFNEDNLRLVDKIDLPQFKTRSAAQFLDEVFSKSAGRTLVLTEAIDHDLFRSFRNITGVQIAYWKNINAYDVIKSDKVLFTKNAWKDFLSEKGLKKEKTERKEDPDE